MKQAIAVQTSAHNRSAFHWLKTSYVAFVYLFFYLPLLVLVVFSFNSAKIALMWQGATFHWYHVLWHDTNLQLIACHSIFLGVLVASFSAVFGTLIATTLFRYQFRGKQLFYALLFVLIVAPDIVLAIGFLMFFNLAHLPLGFWSLLIAHCTFCLPFAAMMIYSRISILDQSIFEAARDLGARDMVIYRKIVFPLLAPAIWGAWLLCFTLSLDDVIISYFVSGPSFEILPLRIYAMVRLGVNPEVSALSTVMLAITFLLVLLSQWVLKRRPT